MKEQSETQMSTINNKEKLLNTSQYKGNNQNTTQSNDQTTINNNKSFVFIYLLMIGITFASNLENGAITSALFKIKEDYYFEDAKLGLIDTVNCLGKILSAIFIISSINNTKNYKCHFITFLLFKVISLFSSTFTSSPIVFYICQFISGVSQAFLIIYFPIWIDQYYIGFTARKPFLISLLQFCAPISIVIGFGLSTVFFLKWKLVVYIEAFSLIFFCGVIILTSESNYIKQNTNNHNPNQQLFPNQSLYELRPPAKATMKKIANEPLFILLSLSIIFSFFVFSSIKHWSTYYMIQHIEISDRGIRFCAFALIIFSGPIIGIVFGGITTSLIGGYEQKKAVVYCLLYHIIGYGFSWLLFLFESTVLYILSLWVLFFFNSASVIIELGILITVFPSPCKGDSFCFLNFLIYLIGNLPSCLIYGTLNESTKSINDKTGIFFSVQMNILSIFVLLIASFIRFNKPSPVYPVSKNRVTEIVAQGIGFIFGQYANIINE